MAEIRITPITLNGSGTMLSKVVRITRGLSTIQSVATFAGKSILIVKSGGSFGGVATLPAVNSRFIRYVKSSIKGATTIKANIHKYKTVSAHISGGSSMETYITDRDIRESMLEYLPPYYQGIKDMQSLIATEANEFTRLHAKLDELFAQFFVDTATYSLDDWADKTNAKNGVNSTLEAKRESVKQRLTGLGTITPVVLKSIVDSFYSSEMTELPSPGVISFKIIGKRGQPDNYEEILSATNEFIPEHLKPKFLFSYLTWEEVEEAGLTWEQAENYTYKGLEEAFLL